MTFAHLAILRISPGATVQDAGRAGKLALSLPPSGPLDPTAYAAANLALSNDPRAAAIEIPLGTLEARSHASAPMAISIDGERPLALAPGETLRVASVERAVRYLAVQGGFDVPVVLGSRATLLVARIGGFQGRMLRAGDLLPVSGGKDERQRENQALPTLTEPADPTELQIVAGPHLARLPDGAWETLLETTWRVSRHGDRVGVRLDGGRVPGSTEDLPAPVPMVRGAIQIATDGTPIVLGPDHPVTGGYPVIAVVTSASQALLARLRPGRALRLALR